MRSWEGIETSRRLYQWATLAEKKALLKQLTEDRTTQQQKYKKRFIAGANTHRPDYLRFLSDGIGEDVMPLALTFHQGLLRDESGIFWIVKQFNPQAREDVQPREARNSPQYERLAYLLARDRANYAPIRFVHLHELPQEAAISKHPEHYYLTRVATAKNFDAALLAQSQTNDSFAAIFVANIFMRKWDQHINNFAFVNEVPVAIDHDLMGPATTFPHTPSGLSTFHLAFLSFKLVATLPYLRPEHPVDAQAKERLKYHFIRQNHREAWGIMQDMIQGLGLGAGLIQAEGLRRASLRRSIESFTDLDDIPALIDRSGFQGKEAESIVHYLQQSQQTLRQDVSYVWRCLSGENSPL